MKTQLWLAVLLILGLLSMAGDGWAQTGALTRDPALLVKKYLELDSKGARLHALTWEVLKPYVAWKEEPVWGHIVVIGRYNVIEDLEEWDVRSNLDVVIPVEFSVIGALYLEQPTFHVERRVERIGFRVKAVQGFWRIIEPILPPHVGYKRAMNFVRQAIVEETNPVRAGSLDRVRDELKRAQ